MPNKSYEQLRNCLKDVFRQLKFTIYLNETEELTTEIIEQHFEGLNADEISYLYQETLYESGDEILKRLDAKY